MRPDLRIQNLLAQASSLLFRIGDSLAKDDTCSPTQILLKVEIATFFSEGKRSLSDVLSEMETPMSKESGRSALNVGSVGAGLNSEPIRNECNETLSQETARRHRELVESMVQELLKPNTSSPDGPVRSTETPISPEAPSGNSSSGGTGDFPRASELQWDSSPPPLSGVRLYYEPTKSSGKFLRLTCSNGKPLLVATDDISNILAQPDGTCNIYYKSQVDPDEVSTPFEKILELLNA